jgi:hypothetical protein
MAELRGEATPSDVRIQAQHSEAVALKNGK